MKRFRKSIILFMSLAIILTTIVAKPVKTQATTWKPMDIMYAEHYSNSNSLYIEYFKEHVGGGWYTSGYEYINYNESKFWLNRYKTNNSFYVKLLQSCLNKMGAKLDVDGSYGPATEKAVKVFQISVGLDADGSCGPGTWRKIAITLDLYY